MEMEEESENKSILHELYVFSEWKSDPEYMQKRDGILPENISGLWKWTKFFGAEKSLIDNVTVFKQDQQKWQLALGDQGKVIGVLTDNILEIRTKRSDYATISARTTVSRDGYSQWRKLVWSPDCSFLALAYGNGVVSFFDLTASNLFNIPIDCSRPGGLECTDTTHAVAEIIFMPLRVKDIKWNWEVLVVTYDGKLRGFLVSQTDGFKLHHTFRFDGGVSALTYDATHYLLYVAGVPRPASSNRDPESPLRAGITAWRILNDDPFYKLSVVVDQTEAQLATDRLHMYLPFLSGKKVAFIVRMVISFDGYKMACIHSNGDITIWRLPIVKQISRWPLSSQHLYNIDSPLQKNNITKRNLTYHPVDINWWSNEEVIVSRFNGAVTVCRIEDLTNILGKKPEFLQGAPQVTAAYDGAFMALECESRILPGKKSQSDENMDVVILDTEEDSFIELTKELIKTVLYTVTDLETFQPKPKKITVISRMYRLLGIKSTTPSELFNRKIDSGKYKEALNLAAEYNLDSDLVYQQQWRKVNVSSDAIRNYLSKVSKKIWVVHQCVDRLPETLPAADELLNFGLKLTNEEILKEINKDREDNLISDPDQITLEDLNTYTSELLRCRHVMLFYRERLRLYESILKTEKSTYVKDEYDCLRSKNVVHCSIELAKEGRIEALECLWPHITSITTQLMILEMIPETLNPCSYQQLLPTSLLKDRKLSSPPAVTEQKDWCRKQIFKSIWSSDWSEDKMPESNVPQSKEALNNLIKEWYNERARQIEERSGLVSHAMRLVNLGVERGTGELKIKFHLVTLETLIYELNIFDVTIKELHDMTTLETSCLLMKKTTAKTIASDLKKYLMPYLRRLELVQNVHNACLDGLTTYLEHVSTTDLTFLWTLFRNPEYQLSVKNKLNIAERCLYAHKTLEQFDMASQIVESLPVESDENDITDAQIRQRIMTLTEMLHTVEILGRFDAAVTLRHLKNILADPLQVRLVLTNMARNLAKRDPEPQMYHWDQLLQNMLELHTKLFKCVPKELIHEIYVSALLTSGNVTFIRMASDLVEWCGSGHRSERQLVSFKHTVMLVLNATKEYINSASSLVDPALALARSCLNIIKEITPEMQREIDLLNAFDILHSFGVTMLPVQVRLCEDHMSIIEECLKSDENAYQASHKLMKLANLLKVSGDDERKREGLVMHLVGMRAMRVGPSAQNECVAAARRLAALRYAPAADLLRHVALSAPAHVTTAERRNLLAAALTTCSYRDLWSILEDRVNIEVDNIHKELGEKLLIMQDKHVHSQESAEDEFSDAVTTPVIEIKEFAPTSSKKPLYNYLKDSLHDKVPSSHKPKYQITESSVRTVHHQEFYRTLYPQHEPSAAYYRYDRFVPDAAVTEGHASMAHSTLQWFYGQTCFEDEESSMIEAEVIQKIGEELLYKDSPLAVLCFLRALKDLSRLKEFVQTQSTNAAISLALYAMVIKVNAVVLQDNMFLTAPVKLARLTLKNKVSNPEEWEIIKICLDKLTNMVECDKVKSLGYSINSLLFNADEEYRQEVIFRMAKSPLKSHILTAVQLAEKYGLDSLLLWVMHANAIISNSQNKPTADVLSELSDEYMVNAFKLDKDRSIACLMEELWESIKGVDHSALVYFFTLLKYIDERASIGGLQPAEHVKLLKKSKAACKELDYKLLLDQPTAAILTAHLLDITKPENVGMLMKLLRSLPASFKIPVSVNTIYTKWLGKLFFSVSGSATNKKWMQQYRLCSSYFSKLAKEDMLEFFRNICFSDEAIDCVPSGTRTLMLIQAVDYCQKEHENGLKLFKSDVEWSQIAEQLALWAQFLEEYHSDAVQAIIEPTKLENHQLWKEIEKSNGSVDKVRAVLAQLLLRGVRPSDVTRLLACFFGERDLKSVFITLLRDHIRNEHEAQMMVEIVSQYHKQDPDMTESLVEDVLNKAAEYQLPPHKLIGLLSITKKNQIKDCDDISKILNYSMDLIKAEWPNNEYANNLKEEQLQTAAGRRDVFLKLVKMADTWSRKKALVDVLHCWPVDRQADNDARSVQCEFVHELVTSSADRTESVVLIKLLLRKPDLTDQEIQWLCSGENRHAVIDLLWVILLSKSEECKRHIPELLVKYKSTIEKSDVEDDLIKELLDNGMLVQVVATPLYPTVVNFILNQEPGAHNYNVKWAFDKLKKANFIAEAGNLRLLASGVPAPLRTFSQCVLDAQ